MKNQYIETLKNIIDSHNSDDKKIITVDSNRQDGITTAILEVMKEYPKSCLIVTTGSMANHLKEYPNYSNEVHKNKIVSAKNLEYYFRGRFFDVVFIDDSNFVKNLGNVLDIINRDAFTEERKHPLVIAINKFDSRKDNQ